MHARRKTHAVKVGNIFIGSDYPIVIQSMTNTPTEDVAATICQIIELIEAGSEMVRITIKDEQAAKAAVSIIKKLRQKKYATPIIGDFHYNGHMLLQKFPETAKLLDKYRINPGNIGKGESHLDNFAQIIKIAIQNKKPVRIGVNAGSLDQELFSALKEQNQKRKKPVEIKEVWYEALIQSALKSAACAEKLGLPKNKIILSVKSSDLQDLITLNEKLAKRCFYPFHLGLTEAGSDIEGISASSAALGILLQQGIGDTIRVSLTPQPNVSRAREVEVCKAVLQSLGFRHFIPKVTSCPGCGRTKSDEFIHLADDVKSYIKKNMPDWQKKYPGIETMTVAVMGCVVNGPGESKHADIGISLPGASDKPQALVFAKGELIAKLDGKNINKKFLSILNNHIREQYS
ncbi:MAG: flavodoxin-dependent (E)-4-hydroxy-3-methylbut-2-enyl-diphosphate synthase [Candidatus Omnitrophica bacterium]|nr:flavodoxin-dependent (E)-4-hydroxy-3-methylbut-2-enyl-diphosphate synthase [Candidatus Omnitrophota bacterium]